MFTKYSSGEIQPSMHTHLKHQFLRASSDDFTKNALHNKIKKIVKFELTYKMGHALDCLIPMSVLFLYLIFQRVYGVNS